MTLCNLLEVSTFWRNWLAHSNALQVEVTGSSERLVQEITEWLSSYQFAKDVKLVTCVLP